VGNKKGFVNFGADAPRPDNSSNNNYPGHQVRRDNDLLYMENLKNIDKVVGEESTSPGCR